MSETLEIICWAVTIALMLAGLIGAVFPVIPDSLFILAGAFLQHFTVQPNYRVGWWTLGALSALCVLAHIVDFTAGAMGARKFGGSRWGALGAFVGAVAGLWFFPIGLFVGPVIGVVCAEVMLARRSLGPAVKSSWGTLLGTTAGMIGKLLIDVTMVGLFVLAVLH